jgi:hypothetical protein
MRRLDVQTGYVHVEERIPASKTSAARGLPKEWWETLA